ncbi:MAG TPA: BON domain-containing protein [Burkholderiales bacterium]|nr:BON domain-containing protein [Burkholderiales bacterium]
MRAYTASVLTLLAALSLAACNRTDQSASNAGSSGPGTTTSPAPATAPPPTADNASGASQGSATASGPAATAGAAIDDATVTARVKAALAAAQGISGTDISVETQQGTVILTGKVADATQSKRAAEVAGGVEGVRSVDNRLQTSG